MIKRFNFLTEDEERIRTEVFVEEQGFKEEFDSVDDNCIHLVKYIDNKAVGVCRLYPDKDQIYYIGRVAVDKNFRGKSIGRELLLEAEKVIKAEGGGISAVSAQVRVQPFYEGLGYKPVGEVYLDEYCPHIHMEKHLS